MLLTFSGNPFIVAKINQPNLHDVCFAVLTGFISVSVERTRTESDGGGGVVFPGACGPFPHGYLSGVVEQCADVASGASKTRLLVAVQACASVIIAFTECT